MTERTAPIESPAVTTAQATKQSSGITLLSRRLGHWLGALRLSTKAMLLGVGLTTIIIAAVFATLSFKIRDETQRLLRSTLVRSEQQVIKMQEDQRADLLWVSSQVSANPTLRAAMETYRLEHSEHGLLDEDLIATVGNELNKIWGGLRHDLLFVTNEAGLVLASNSTSEVSPRPGQSFADLPTIRRALNPTRTPGDQNFGVINVEGQHYFVGSSPVTLRGYVIGTLTLGDRIGRRFLPDLRAFFGGEAVVVAGQEVISSTLPGELTPQIEDTEAAVLGTALAGGDGTVTLGKEQFMVTSMSLGSDESDRPVSLYLLRSFTAAVAEPNRKLMEILATQALFAILLAAVLSWIAARAGVRPLKRFVAFMKNVAETGDYSRRFATDNDPASLADKASSGTGDNTQPGEVRNEMAMLVNGFNSMLAEIEHRDTSLKRAHADLMESMRVVQQKEKQLRQLQKMEAIGLLAGGVAHDFNNILMVISGFSDLALKYLPEGHEARENIDEVRRATKTASLLTRQLLSFSSKQITKPRVININKLITEMEKILGTVVGETKALKTRLDPEAGAVLVDPAQMEQVLLNLTVNARDAIKSRGTIEITTRLVNPGEVIDGRQDLGVERGHVMVSVSDDGCGMDTETRSHMFEPFFTTKGKGKGTGLGLSTVHGIVKQSGGHINVESEPGKGTVVSLYFPRVLEGADSPASVRQAEMHAGAGTILLVEDETDVRRVVGQILRMSGYNVIETSSPLEALVIVEESGDLIDVLLTDVIMPVMNGRELHDKVMELRPEIKTLYVSGYADGVMDEAGILPDGVNFLQKPFAPEALLAKLHRLLNEDF